MKNAALQTKSSLIIQIVFENSKPTHATGFLVQHEAELFLISNWHVFSGRSCFSGQPSKNSGELPKKIKFLATEGYTGHENKEFRLIREIEIELFDRDGAPNWVQHPKGQEIDLAGIQLSNEEFEGREYVDPFSAFPHDVSLRPGEDVYIVGYPFSTRVQGPSPIWKHGTIASEPGYKINGLPLLLVDADAKGGMSGSPVYCRRPQSSISTVLGKFLQQENFSFVGIYSGRIGQSLQVGRVVRAREIVHMLNDPRPGDYRIIPQQEQIFPDEE